MSVLDQINCELNKKNTSEDEKVKSILKLIKSHEKEKINNTKEEELNNTKEEILDKIKELNFMLSYNRLINIKINADICFKLDKEVLSKIEKDLNNNKFDHSDLDDLIIDNHSIKIEQTIVDQKTGNLINEENMKDEIAGHIYDSLFHSKMCELRSIFIKYGKLLKTSCHVTL